MAVDNLEALNLVTSIRVLQSPVLGQRVRARREAYPNESRNQGVLLDVLLSNIGVGERTTSGIILNPENTGKII